MIVTLHDKSTTDDGQGIVHLRGEENGVSVQIVIAGTAALADSFPLDFTASYEVTIATK